MKNVDISFNNKMRQFRLEYERKHLKGYMKRYWNSYQHKRFKESYYPAYKKNDNKKNKFLIFKELIHLLFKWNCIPYHYFRYGLYDKKYNKDLIDKFLPETVFYYSILPNINAEYNLLDNKFTTNDIFLSNGIPCPKCVLKIIEGHIINNCGNEIDCAESLNKYLKDFTTDLIAKYANCGSGGHQIQWVKKIGDDYIINDKKLTYEKLKTDYNGWLFQEKIYNHKILSNIHPSSLNTFRIMTYLKNHQPQILYVMLKFGNYGAQTDNAHTKGIYINVNIDTGRTDGVAYNEDLESFQKHPYTNKKLQNIKIPYFKEIINLAKRCALLFPSLTFVGWDITLTEFGAVVLEGNSSPGLTLIQRTNNGMEKFLNLYYDKK